jgi:2',3'-cyclic-nucleotide 2'-phosphodiesterase (5'-nucleotidase family)
MHYSSVTTVLATIITTAYAWEPCEHPERDVVLTRNVRRMQPEAIKAVSEPRAPLEWGQLNFMHTSDTHGWLVCHNALLVLVSQYTDTNSRKVTLKNRTMALTGATTPPSSKKCARKRNDFK